jgi:hypothetical protein
LDELEEKLESLVEEELDESTELVELEVLSS